MFNCNSDIISLYTSLFLPGCVFQTFFSESYDVWFISIGNLVISRELSGSGGNPTRNPNFLRDFAEFSPENGSSRTIYKCHGVAPIDSTNWNNQFHWHSKLFESVRLICVHNFRPLGVVSIRFQFLSFCLLIFWANDGSKSGRLKAYYQSKGSDANHMKEGSAVCPLTVQSI